MEVKPHPFILLEHQWQPNHLKNEKSKMKIDALKEVLPELRQLIVELGLLGN